MAAQFVVAAVTGYFHSIACAANAKGVDDSLQVITLLYPSMYSKFHLTFQLEKSRNLRLVLTCKITRPLDFTKGNANPHICLSWLCILR